MNLTMSLNGFYNASTYYDFQTKEDVVDYMPVNSWFAANSDDAAVDTVVKQAATNYVMGEARCRGCFGSSKRMVKRRWTVSCR